jgi:site-specific DNA-cytosine methylase
MEGRILVDWTIDLIEMISSHIDTWTLEQVPKLIFTDLMQKYNGKVIHMQKYGVPQTRRRMLLGNISWEKLEHFETNAMNFKQVADSIGFQIPTHINSLNNGCTKRVNGIRSLKHTDGNTVYTHRPLTVVSNTVTGSNPVMYNSIIHRGEKLPIEIVMALQTFPFDYVLQGPHREKRRMIANAVPPTISRALISTIYI